MFISEKYRSYVDAAIDKLPFGKGVLRSMVKTCTWRIVATTDTFLLGWLITGNVTHAGAIAGFEVATKMFLYYFHERVWARVGGHRYPPKKKRVRIKCRECGTPNSKVVHQEVTQDGPAH